MRRGLVFDRYRLPWSWFAAVLIGVGGSGSALGAFEPNDAFSSAVVLGPAVRSISDSVDGDIGPVDTLLGHFDPSYTTLLASDDDSSMLGNGKASGMADRPAHSNGGFYIAVSGAGDVDFMGSHSESGRYQVVFETFDASGQPLETVEVCESFSTGDRIDILWLDPDPARIGGTVDVNIDNLYACGEGDPRDFWRFTGLQGGAPFRAEVTSATFDSLLGDFGDDGELHGSDDNGGVGMLSLLSGVIPDSGELVLAVTGTGDTSFDGEHFQSGEYTLELVVVPEPATAVLLLVATAVLAGAGWRVRRHAGDLPRRTRRYTKEG